LYKINVQSSREFVVEIYGSSNINFKGVFFSNVLVQKEKAGSFSEPAFINPGDKLKKFFIEQ